MNTGVQVPGRTEPVTIGTYSVDYDFFRTMGIRLIAGRTVRPRTGRWTMPRFPSPTIPAAIRAQIARGGVNVVINELAARRMGFSDPARAVGRQVRAAMADEEYGLVPVNIIGVVQDFALPLDPRADRSDHVPDQPHRGQPPRRPLPVGGPASACAATSSRRGSGSPPTRRSTPTSATTSSPSSTRPKPRAPRCSPASLCWR